MLMCAEQQLRLRLAAKVILFALSYNAVTYLIFVVLFGCRLPTASRLGHGSEIRSMPNIVLLFSAVRANTVKTLPAFGTLDLSAFIDFKILEFSKIGTL